MFLSGCINNENSDTYDFYVNWQYNENTPGWNCNHFQNITTAIEKASQNTSIFVYNGTYQDHIEINEKNITLTGENPYSTILEGNGDDDVIFILKDGQIISGFTIKNTSTLESNDEHAGIDIRSDENTITNNIFINTTCGIYIRYGDKNNIAQNIFRNNSKYGVYLESRSDENNLAHNVFVNNRYGLRIRGSNFCRVSYNAFLDNKYGEYLCCGTKYTVSYGNIFCNNAEWDTADHFNNRWDTILPDEWQHNNIDYSITINEPIGNYWDRFHLPLQGAYDNDSDGIIDSAYNIPEGDTDDQYPLMEKPDIDNQFMTKEEICST